MKLFFSLPLFYLQAVDAQFFASSFANFPEISNAYCQLLKECPSMSTCQHLFFLNLDIYYLMYLFTLVSEVKFCQFWSLWIITELAFIFHHLLPSLFSVPWKEPIEFFSFYCCDHHLYRCSILKCGLDNLIWSDYNSMYPPAPTQIVYQWFSSLAPCWNPWGVLKNRSMSGVSRNSDLLCFRCSTSTSIFNFPKWL